MRITGDLLPLQEHQEQAALIQWFQVAYPTIKTRLFAIPNGTNKSRAAASRHMAEGLRSGVPDLMLPIPRGDYHGLFIELKRSKGGRLSDTQKDWLAFLSGQGYMAVVCHGFDEAKDVRGKYLFCKQKYELNLIKETNKNE